MPIYATTSEFRNEVWGKRPLSAPVNSEQVPEPMSLLAEESEPLLLTSRAPSPVPLVRSPVSRTFEEKVPHRTKSNSFSYLKCFLKLVVLMSGLMALSIVPYNWPSVHSAFSEKWSFIRGSQELPTSRHNQPTSSFEIPTVAYEGQSALNRCVKPSLMSLVPLQIKFEKVMDDADINSFAYNLKHAENDIIDMSQRAKHSSLPNKDLLVEQLYLITSTTKDTGRSFQRFSSRVRGMLDQIMVANRPNRFAPALLKLGVFELFQESNAIVTDLEELRVQFSLASGMAAQFKEDYTRQKAEKRSPTNLAYYWVDQKVLRDFETNFKLLEDICAELERVSMQVKGELSLFHRISNDLHVIHDQLSAVTAEMGSF
ncbi:hypothetical protein RSOL_324110 [Rhizoctonia solani AG-3 Rhs1AP]|uniref:Uncharacterized protein n=2 Tax=Rhizoctonia solani AG-3 TaxID=1086053 RepID=A0A074RYD2_9AGAM|nr:hypothetical protein RSOL_324110 [Rhizoctonia solani AG-3 Rhs1AP]KEP52106.1 hypothetical protein V565_050620 [Rhizoctonia solani 123E]